MPSLLRIPWISWGWTPAKWALESITMNKASGGDRIPVELFQILKDEAVAGVQPLWIQGIRSGDGVGEDQETTA